jgi:exodeoxyribonuclease VII small subunit
VTEPTEPALDFERALSELEGLVQRLESGDLALEESLRLFERGVQLTRRCQSALAEAEQRVEKLVAGPDGAQLEPFEPDEPGP